MDTIGECYDTDSIGECHNISDNILDGIFSTEEMLRWKKEAEEEDRRWRKTCLNSFNQSYIIEIEPKQATKRGKEELRAKFEEYLRQARLRKYILVFLNECSYFPFLFMFSMTCLSMSLTGLPCLVISLSICIFTSTFHLAYMAQSRSYAGLEKY